MFKPLASYDTKFPPFEEITVDQMRMMHKVQNHIGINVEGCSKIVTQGEAMINWQSENASA